MARCENCPYKEHGTCRDYTPEDPDYLVIGEAPGRQEIEDDEPLVGKSGKLLWLALGELGISKEDCTVTNVVNCRPPYNEKPVKEARKACKGYLREHLRNHDHVLALGAVAAREILNGDRGIWQLRGRFYELDDGTRVLPTIHPAAVLREPSIFRDLQHDLRKLPNLADLPNGDDLQTDYKTFDDVDRAIEAVERLAGQGILSCDIETTGLNPRTNEITELGISWTPGRTAIFPGRLFEHDDFCQALTDCFQHGEATILFQGSLFDVPFLREHGVHARTDLDTMLAHYLLDERQGTHGLDFLSKYYLNAPDYGKEFRDSLPDDAKKHEYHKADPEDRRQYLAYDCDFPIRIHRALDDELDEDLQWVYRNLLIPSSNMLADVMRRGMLADEDHLEELREEYESRLSSMEHELQAIADKYGWSSERYIEETDAKTEPDFLNPRSPKQLLYVLEEVLGLPRYKKGTTNKHALNSWIHDVMDCPFSKSLVDDLAEGEADLNETQEKQFSLFLEDDRARFVFRLKEYRNFYTLYSRYIDGMEDHVEEDGRVYTQILLHTTRTGRTSSRDPNLQNVAKNKDIRNVFVAPNGWKLIEADFSQAELRVLAVLSQDPTLKEIYREDRDVHNEMAARVFGDDYTKDQRTIVKRIVYGLAYGQTVKALAEQNNVPQGQAQAWRAALLDQIPKAKEWLQEAGEKPLNGETPTSFFGRKRRFPLITRDNKADIRREARNFPIQSTASDLLLFATIRLHNELSDHDAYITNLIHDSILIEVPEDDVKAVARLTAETMNEEAMERVESDVPFPSDVEVGNRWGSMEEMDL